MTPTKQQIQILHVLANADRELYGLDLVAAGVGKRTSLYVVLGRMEDRGWIEGREDMAAQLPRRLYRQKLIEDREEATNPPPRRLYSITAAGRAQLLPPAKAR